MKNIKNYLKWLNMLFQLTKTNASITTDNIAFLAFILQSIKAKYNNKRHNNEPLAPPRKINKREIKLSINAKTFLFLNPYTAQIEAASN